jgi:hypothetical protein
VALKSENKKLKVSLMKIKAELRDLKKTSTGRFTEEMSLNSVESSEEDLSKSE